MDLKNNTVKYTLLSLVGMSLVTVVIHSIIAISGVIQVNKRSQEVADPALIQRTAIEKAIDLLTNQTDSD